MGLEYLDQAGFFSSIVSVYAVVLFSPVLTLAIIVFYLIKRRIEKNNEVPLEVWQKITAGALIAVTSIAFISSLNAIHYGKVGKINEVVVSTLIMFLLSFLFIAVGLLIHKHSTISDGLIIGGIFSLVINFTINIISASGGELLKSWVISLILALGIAGIALITYRYYQDGGRDEV